MNGLTSSAADYFIQLSLYFGLSLWEKSRNHRHDCKRGCGLRVTRQLYQQSIVSALTVSEPAANIAPAK